MPLDFSDARYLGMRHGSRELGVWDDITTGFPAAFLEAPEATSLGRAIARLQGLEAGVVAPSTLHFFWDWFGQLHPSQHQIFSDEQLYQVGNWGVERAAGKGIPVIRFAHRSPLSLQVLLKKKRRRDLRPIVVTDGWCPLCGKAAPLREYLEILGPHGGWLVVDDTQAMGILALQKRILANSRPIRIAEGKGAELLTISSLAKGFGAPVAALCGSAAMVDDFRAKSETRMFASPASTVAIRAAQHALRTNAKQGDGLRGQLLRNVRLFKDCLAEDGIATGGGCFPVQFLPTFNGFAAQRIHADLWRQGIRAVLSKGHDGQSMICFLLNVRMTRPQIVQACKTISLAAQKATSATGQFLKSAMT
jgi:8-amino-7-oxononanoate synthase